MAVAVLPLIAGCVVYRHPRPRVVVTEPPPPPAAQVEVVPARPALEYVWVPGAWEWDGRWVWVAGRWAPPPRHGAIWIGGHWEHRAHERIWIRGHWG